MANQQRRAAALLFLCICCCLGCAGLRPNLSAANASQRIDRSFEQAQDLERKGSLPEARDAYEQVIAKQPDNVEALHRLAVVCTLQNDHVAAADSYNRALTLAPQNAELLCDAGYACYVRKEYVAAEQLLTTALMRDPRHERACNNLGLVQGMTGRIDTALATFERVQPRSAALKNLAYVHQLRGDREQALVCYQQAQKLDPQVVIPRELAEQATVSAPVVAEAKDNAKPTAPVQTASAEAPAPDMVASAPASPVETPMIPADADLVEETTEFVAPVGFEQEASHGDDEAWMQPAEPVEFTPPAETQPEQNQSVADPQPIIDSSSAVGPVTLPVAQLAVVRPAWPPQSSDSDAEAVATKRDLQPLTDGSQKPGTEADDWEGFVFDEPEQPQVLPTEDDMPGKVELVVFEAPLEPAAQADWYETASKAKAEVLDNPADLALKDICPVTLKDQQQLMKADPLFAATYQEEIYRFASAEAAARFRADPVRYVPAAGGLDVVAVTRGEGVIDGQLQHAAWYRGRLYLFAAADSLTQFCAAPAEFASPPQRAH